MPKSKKKVLQDHKQKGKKLLPPLLAAMGDKYSPYSWTKQIIPEIIWIALLQKTLGLYSGIRLVKQISLHANQFFPEKETYLFCKISSFSKLSRKHKASLIKKLQDEGSLKDIQKALSPLFLFFPKSPLRFLKPKTKIYKDNKLIKIMNELLPELYDKASRDSALAMATCAAIMIEQGKLKFSKETFDHMLNTFNSIESYPNTEESKAAASSLRAMVPMFILKNDEGQDDLDPKWNEYFWSQLSGFGPCMLEHGVEYYDKKPKDKLGKVVFKFCNSARKELHERIDRWGFDLTNIEFYEVVTALLARQTNLAIDMAMSVQTWTPHSAHLFHRAMADVYITLAWIFKDPQKRAEQFVEDGIGKIKLEIAHREKYIEEHDITDDDDRVKLLVKIWKHWISSQRLADLVEVNLGSWSGITTRKMAEEADCLDFYNYVYQPFSAATHSAWSHLSTINMQYCKNPTHRFHKVATSFDYKPHPEFLYLTAKYLQKAFDKFDQETGIKCKAVCSFDQLYEDLYGEG